MKKTSHHYHSLLLITIVVMLYGCSVNQNLSIEHQNSSIPLSTVAKSLGANIVWNPKLNKVTLYKGEVRVAIFPNHNIATTGKEASVMAFPAFIKDHEIYIPISFYQGRLKDLFRDTTKIIENANVSKWKKILSTRKTRVKNFRVVIDPGHGGKDPGAIGIGGAQEKDYTLAISLRVAAHLQQLGTQVMMTRNSDRYISLGYRVNSSNQTKAQCVVSIHLNSAAPKAHGFEIWISRNKKQKRYRKSWILSHFIRYYLEKQTPLKSRGIRNSGFQIIHKTKIPAVLVECCFISNKKDLAWISQPKSQDKLADSIARGILSYYLYLNQLHH